MDGWNTSFLLGGPIFRGYVGFREGNTNNGVDRIFLFPISCGQVWMSCENMFGRAPRPVRAKRSSTTSEGTEGSTKIRVLASGFLIRNPLGGCAKHLWRLFGYSFLHPAPIFVPCSCLATNLFFP